MTVPIDYCKESGDSAAKRSNLPLYFQIMLITCVTIFLIIVPVRLGPMIVVPLSDFPIKPWLDTRHDVIVLGLGRLPGSIIVYADRDALLPFAIVHGAILLPALPTLCEQRFYEQEVS